MMATEQFILNKRAVTPRSRTLRMLEAALKGLRGEPCTCRMGKHEEGCPTGDALATMEAIAKEST